ncbi:hypothetical protein FNV43_RR19104 [Rhamnella rubrinervis]|uniref:Transcription repressor n=1 Tax=Rhamnella rubrinervis TaxID=2594499 RepID=A0A8K0GWX7_9ROSA|nr:hypothetical protein FNV43_RR19104 [Rhamnella rubrinervis]
MAKRFRLRISRVIPTFQSCRSKDPSTLPSNPVPSFCRFSPVKHHPVINLHSPTPPPLPSSNTHYSAARHYVSSAFLSVGCGCSRSRPTLSDDDHNEEAPEFQWEKEDKWHVVAKIYHETPRRKIYNSSVSGCDDGEDDILPPPPPPPSAEKKKRRVKKKRTTARFRMSTSSAESGLFSSDGYDDVDDEETETLVSSSRSFSTDSSSEFNPHLETIREAATVDFRSQRRKKKVKKPKRRAAKGGSKARNEAKKSGSTWLSASSPESESPARLSMFQKLIPCTVEGKVRESFAVVKKSEDPYVDFKRSMMEMIMEKQMFNDKDLEQLLHCFLSLNSRHHQGIIVQAFSEIWEALFCTRPSS